MIFSIAVSSILMQDLDTEIIVATARGTNSSATAVSANVIVDERQMNALFLDLVSINLYICHFVEKQLTFAL